MNHPFRVDRDRHDRLGLGLVLTDLDHDEVVEDEEETVAGDVKALPVVATGQAGVLALVPAVKVMEP